MRESSAEPEKTEERRYFECIFNSDRKVPEVLLERIRHCLKTHGEWTEVTNWRETGATCDVQYDDQIVISVILARLFGISGYTFILQIARQRSWREFFASLLGTQSTNSSGKILSDFRYLMDLAIKACGVDRVVWSKSLTYSDFSNTEEWIELTDQESGRDKLPVPSPGEIPPISRCCQLLIEIHRRNYGESDDDLQEIESILWEHDSLWSDDQLPDWFLETLKSVQMDEVRQFRVGVQEEKSQANAFNIFSELQSRLHWDLTDEGKSLLVRFPSQHLKAIISTEFSALSLILERSKDSERDVQ